MTGRDAYERRTTEFHQAAARLETIERRHRILEAGFRCLEKRARDEHDLARTAADLIIRLARLIRWMERGEVEALRVAEALQTAVTEDAGRG